MKSFEKVTRLQLKINSVEQPLFFGLVSAEPDYKLSLAINRRLKISLKNISPVKVIDNTGSELAFSRFSHTSGTQGLIFNLVSNRTGRHFLLGKLRNVDYIFQVNDPDGENNIDKLTQHLREIEAINAVFRIDLNTFKDKNLQYLTH